MTVVLGVAFRAVYGSRRLVWFPVSTELAAVTIKVQPTKPEYSQLLTEIDAWGYKSHDLEEEEYGANLVGCWAEMLDYRVPKCLNLVTCRHSRSSSMNRPA